MRVEIKKRVEALESKKVGMVWNNELIVLNHGETEADYYRDHPEITIKPNVPHLIIRIAKK